MHNLESGSTMANRAIITLLLLIAAVASVQAGNRQSSAGAGTGRSHLSERAGSENSSDQMDRSGWKHT
ncbi:hypothetical protein BV898_12869 [Hypsibius exemplaris]|uniref:Uncharacterized protein n=1 Tax=Hypsibius exemplaris TaxID=2072580 RepID=A0A1W0WCF1_HYPEX|nr:hypothetical protein BV898_12869 [Hypsibius exemplaris]